MTDPYRDPWAPRGPWPTRSPMRPEPEPGGPMPSNPTTRSLLASYVELRSECAGLEELIERGDLTEQDVMRLDKAVTVMKVGFKIVKKVLRAQGIAGRMKPKVRA